MLLLTDNGSLPFVLAHGAKGAAGVLWLSAADTYVDLWRTAADQVTLTLTLAPTLTLIPIQPYPEP